MSSTSNFQSMFRFRGTKASAQDGQSVSCIRGIGTRTTSHGNRKLCQQGHDGQRRHQSEYRLS